MADLINFVSKTDLDAKKVQRREERQAVLRKVSVFSPVSYFRFLTMLAVY